MSDVRKLAKIVADHSRQIKGLSGGPQAAYSSIEGGSMDSYDSDGKLRLRIGAQDDGTQGVKYVQGPPPPRPTAPAVSVDGPVVRVRWDGVLLGGHIPEDFSRIDVHFSLASEDLEADEAVRGNLATSAGNETVLAATSTGTYRVGLVAMSQSRARSEMSDVTEVEVELVNLKGAIDTAVDNASGGSNHYRPAPPEGTDHTENDLWFDTSVDPETGLTAYTPHRWDEAAQDWVSVGDQRTAAIQDAQDALRVDVDQIITDGSGTTTYWLPTEPDETAEPTPKSGDIWFDTSDGNKLHRFDSQGWVSASDSRFQTIQDAQDALESDVDAVRNSVDGKNAITQSVDAPPAQYDGAEGDRWERMSSMGSGGQLVSNWRWNGDVWVSTIISDAVLGNVDAAKIGTGYLDAARIEAGSIYADKIVSGLSQNMVPDPGFTNPDISALRLTEALGWGGEWSIADGIVAFDARGATLSGAPNISFAATQDLYAWAAYPGMEIRSSLEVRVLEGGAALRVNLHFSRRDGSTAYVRMEPGEYRTIAGEWRKFEAAYVLPQDAAGYSIVVQYDPAVTTGLVQVRSPFSASAVGGTVIEDGAITTDKIAVGAITAESGVVESLDAGDISVGELDAARIGANTITADKMLVGPRPDNMIVDVAAVTGETAPHQAVDGSTLLIMPGITGVDGYNPGPHLTARSSASPGAGTNRAVVAFGTTNGGTRAPVEPSTGYALSALVRVGNSRPNGTPNVHWAYTEYDHAGVSLGTTYLWASQTVAAWGWSPLVGEFSTQQATSSVEIQLRCNQPTTDVRIVKPAFRPKVGTTLIEDGAITTDKIAVGAITAESGIVGSLDAGVINVGEMNGARIEAGTIDTPQLAFGAATGDVLSVDALNFKTAVGLDIRGSSFRAGDAVEMTEDFGIRQFGPDGALNVSLPSDGSPAEFRGDLSARTLTATGRMSIQGPGAIASGGVLELESGVVPPVSGPQITNTWDRTTFPPLTEQEAPAGLAWADGHFWRCVTTSVSLAEGGRTRVEKISPTGELVGGWDTSFRVNVDGITILNGELYVLAARLSVSGDDSTPVRPRMVVVYDLNGVEQRRWEYTHYGTGTWQPGIGNDGTNIVIAQSWANGDHSYRTLNPTTGAVVVRYDTGFKMYSNVTQFVFGEFDYADGRKKIIAQQRSDLKAFVCYDAAATAPDDAGRSWNAADFQIPVGLAWDGARFHSLTPSGDLVSYEPHQPGRFVGDDEGDWWGAATWATGSQETTAGPATRFRYLHRAQLRRQNGDVPEGVEQARFYLAKGSSEPVRTSLHWVATSSQPQDPSRIMSISSSWSTGANPPAANSFTTAEPGLVRSTIGNFWVDGTGAGQWGPLTFNADGTMSSSAVPDWIPVTTFRTGFGPQTWGFVPAYRIWPDGKVEWRGVIAGSVTTTVAALTVPIAARPQQPVNLLAATNAPGGADASTRIEFGQLTEPDIMRIYRGSADRTWVSLDGTSYYRE